MSNVFMTPTFRVETAEDMLNLGQSFASHYLLPSLPSREVTKLCAVSYMQMGKTTFLEGVSGQLSSQAPCLLKRRGPFWRQPNTQLFGIDAHTCFLSHADRGADWTPSITAKTSGGHPAVEGILFEKKYEDECSSHRLAMPDLRLIEHPVLSDFRDCKVVILVKPPTHYMRRNPRLAQYQLLMGKLLRSAKLGLAAVAQWMASDVTYGSHKLTSQNGTVPTYKLARLCVINPDNGERDAVRRFVKSNKSYCLGNAGLAGGCSSPT